MSSFPRSSVGVRYSVPSQRPDWELSDERVPESVLHDEAAQLLKTILRAWANRKGDAFIGRNIAVHWDKEHPRHGIDPDVAVFSPAPPDPMGITSVRTWKDGYEPPNLAIEVIEPHASEQGLRDRDREIRGERDGRGLHLRSEPRRSEDAWRALSHPDLDTRCRRRSRPRISGPRTSLLTLLERMVRRDERRSLPTHRGG